MAAVQMRKVWPKKKDHDKKKINGLGRLLNTLQYRSEISEPSNRLSLSTRWSVFAYALASAFVIHFVNFSLFSFVLFLKATQKTYQPASLEI